MKADSTGSAGAARRILLAIAVLTLLPGTLQAGLIFLPGKLDSGEFLPDKSVARACYQIRYSTMTATVDDGFAATKIQETIVGPQKAVRTVCLVPLPEGTHGPGAVIAAGIPNRAHAILPAARFLEPAEAQALYESLARGLDSVQILALTGRPALLIPEFELQGQVEIVVEFRQQVGRRQGVWSLRCPMPATHWAAGPVARLSVVATVGSSTGEPLRAMFSPSHHATIERDGLYKAAVRVKADNWSGTDDFRLCWVADKDDLGLRVLAYRAEDEEDGYFLLLGNPTGSAADEKVIDKDVVFVLDTSGSMRGEKIEQARAAIDYCIAQLNPGDRFNVVTFGTEVAGFRDAPVPRSDQTLAAAREFVESVVAKGRTNISGALAKALAGAPQQGRTQITIFLTDGTPTAGELVPEKIIEDVKRVTPCPTRIFVMGVGHDVNVHLLDKLAEVTEGSSEYVEPDEEIDAKVAALYDRLSHPVLTNVVVECGKLPTRSLYPKKLPALFQGSEIMVFGRYRGGGRHTLRISGMLAGQPAEYTCRADFPEGRGGEANEFVAPLWAARKIGYLLQEIRLHGENEELITEVVRLSRKFGIVTEYTEFLALARTELTGDVAVNEARRRMNIANTLQAGQWAFNQSRNDKQLQMRVVATREGNNFLDRRGNLVYNDNIRQVGRQVFYLRDGQWVDAQDPGDRKTRVVKLFSREYLDLLRTNAQFARAQQLGWAVSGNYDDERIIVEKDGSQKSPQLQQRFQQQFLQEPQLDPFRQGPNQLQQIPPDVRNQFRNQRINRRLNQQIQVDPPILNQPRRPGQAPEDRKNADRQKEKRR